MLFQQFNPLPHLVVGGEPLLAASVMVVDALGAVDREANQEVVLPEETTPLVGQQRAIRLQAVGHLPTTGIFPLQGQCLLVEADRAHQRLTAMPGEQHLAHRLASHILGDETFQQLLAQDLVLGLGVELALLLVVAIVAGEVADRADRFDHDIDRMGEGG